MKTYLGLIKLIQACKGGIYVAVHYVSGTYEWLPVDKTEYIRQLQMIGNPEIPFPCMFDVDKDEDIYIRSHWENKQ